MIKTFCSGCKADFSAYVQQLFKIILQLMNDADQGVYTEAWGALDALIKVNRYHLSLKNTVKLYSICSLLSSTL